MDTIVVIIVLVTLLVLFGGAAWFFVRETGVENAKLWLTSPRQIRQAVMPFRGAQQPRPQEEQGAQTEPLVRQAGANPDRTLVLDDSRLRQLAEELRGELTRAAGQTREFDARLTRIEGEITATTSRIEEELGLVKQLPETIDTSVHEAEERALRRIQKLRGQLRTVRMAESPYSSRRCDALADIYVRLARTEAALANVVNPMLLPGEPLQVPEALFDDTFEWENWADVGERAYEFGEAFNQNRLLLEPKLAAQVETFISTLRKALTDTIYPVVRHQAPSSQQKAQLRTGLEQVVRAIAPLRRTLEDAYQAISAEALKANDDDDDDDDDEPVYHA